MHAMTALRLGASRNYFMVFSFLVKIVCLHSLLLFPFHLNLTIISKDLKIPGKDTMIKTQSVTIHHSIETQTPYLTFVPEDF